MSDCYCFDTCTLAATATFRTHGVPEAVTSATPLWLRYLRAVYHSEPPLPFATSHLNYFYHRDTRWASSHPGVEWPMATCEWRGGALTTPNVNHIGLPLRRNMSRAPGQQRCPASQCARWRAEASGNRNTPQKQQKQQRITHAFLMPSTGGRESSGVVLFGDRYSRVAADDEMVEVMRMQTLNRKGTAGHEGANGNGCWLFPAAGSGVWVSVGRSWRAATEHSLTATNSSFIRTSAAWRVRNAGSQAERLLHKHLQSATKERYPALAHAMGYYSLQMGARVFKQGNPHAQLVLTSAPCMDAPKPIRACLPVPTRAGVAGGLPCSCADKPSIPTLSCSGEERRGRAAPLDAAFATPRRSPAAIAPTGAAARAQNGSNSHEGG